MRTLIYSLNRLLWRSLTWTHRWLGILTCLLCAMWFLSGLVMLHVPFPSWRDEERAAALRVIDAEKLNVAPGEALAKAVLTRPPTVFRLEMFGAEPVYRIVDFGQPTSVSAYDGRIISEVGRSEAEARLHETFAPTPVNYLGQVTVDQWTVSSLLTAHRPLHLFALGDGRGTRLYVSSKTGEIVQETTAQERFWNFLGAVPHWIYFTPLRTSPHAWTRTVQWTSGAAAIGAILGVWIGIWRMRLRGSYAAGRISPYRGWLRWHHLSGLAGGACMVAWLGSGWLSVSSLGLFATLTIGPDDLGRYYSAGSPKYEISVETLRELASTPSREITFSWVRDIPFVTVSNGRTNTIFDGMGARQATFSEDTLVRAAGYVLESAKVARVERLDAPDVYWYS
ncbi:MAG TPA: PepSY domain-containing protein, partial [Hyphomicrobium sp.]|nr:PepSY domain-containing protein [Hyphomicrobium sp.]